MMIILVNEALKTQMLSVGADQVTLLVTGSTGVQFGLERYVQMSCSIVSLCRHETAVQFDFLNHPMYSVFWQI